MSRRRFYKAAIATAENGVTLDARPLRTLGKAALLLPNAGLAEAIAAEWRAQGEKIDPYSMPLTKLANAAIDRVGPGRERIVAEMVAYAGNDLVCYRAGWPQELQALQARAWDGVLRWADTALDARFAAVEGVVHHPQPPAALEAVRTYLSARDDFTLSAVYALTALTGSALLAATIERGAIGPDAAWSTALIDVEWQIEHWGEDAEATTRRRSARKEFDAACRFLELVGSGRES